MLAAARELTCWGVWGFWEWNVRGGRRQWGGFCLLRVAFRFLRWVAIGSWSNHWCLFLDKVETREESSDWTNSSIHSHRLQTLCIERLQNWRLFFLPSSSYSVWTWHSEAAFIGEDDLCFSRHCRNKLLGESSSFLLSRNEILLACLHDYLGPQVFDSVAAIETAKSSVS